MLKKIPVEQNKTVNGLSKLNLLYAINDISPIFSQMLNFINHTFYTTIQSHLTI